MAVLQGLEPESLRLRITGAIFRSETDLRHEFGGAGQVTAAGAAGVDLAFQVLQKQPPHLSVRAATLQALDLEVTRAGLKLIGRYAPHSSGGHPSRHLLTGHNPLLLAFRRGRGAVLDLARPSQIS